MDLPDVWITDEPRSERFPYYTRANAGEVLPNPVSPLGWSLVWQQAIAYGWAQGFVDYGIYRQEEGDRYAHDIVGRTFGGYFYIALSHVRLFGFRMGAPPEAIDASLLGAHPDTPPFEPHPDDECPSCTEKIAETNAWVLSTDEYHDTIAAREEIDARRASRPDLTTLTDAELVERARSFLPFINDKWRHHVIATVGGTIGPGIVASICAEIGRPELQLDLLSGLGEVESAQPSWALWDLSRTVRHSSTLSSLFDRGVAEVQQALADPADDEVRAFARQLDEFLRQHGSMGPSEWDVLEPSWEADVSLPLGLLDTMRRAGDDEGPATRHAEMEARRQAAADEVRRALAGKDDQLALFDSAMRSAAIFTAARERSKRNQVKAINEVRLALFELGRRGVGAGVLARPADITMLLADELDDYVANPQTFRDTVAERAAMFTELADLDPPFIIATDPPPLSQWPRRSTRQTAAAVKVGDVLTGGPGSGGQWRGTARIVLSPHEASHLNEGDVMFAPQTDPSWTPLFMVAGAVVVDVGAQNSHATIVSREIGIPCVVSLTGATSMVPDGATVLVDGSAGTVTIEALP